MVIRLAILLDDLQEVKNKHHGVVCRKSMHFRVGIMIPQWKKNVYRSFFYIVEKERINLFFFS